MRLTYEPLDEAPTPRAGDVSLVGLEVVRHVGAWPLLRHVFDLGEDAGLHVEIDPLGQPDVFAVAYSFDGDELLTAL